MAGVWAVECSGRRSATSCQGCWLDGRPAPEISRLDLGQAHVKVARSESRLAADVVGCCRLMGKDEAVALESLGARESEVIERAA